MLKVDQSSQSCHRGLPKGTESSSEGVGIHVQVNRIRYCSTHHSMEC